LSLIELRDDCKTYDLGEVQVRALRNVSLNIEAGEYVALIGASGSGKSTLMNTLGCLDRPTSGSYRLAGEDVVTMTLESRATIRNRRIGFVFQNFNLLPRTSALENVELPLLYVRALSARQRRERAILALQQVGLSDRLEHHPGQLSGGQQQRVAIARALVNQPSILLADEPTGNLDSTTSREVLEVVRQLNAERGLSIVLVTHDWDVTRHAQRAIALHDGRVVADTANSEEARAALQEASRAVA
jgi:ABC-type lipoprotein export system ATPase subunit